MITPQRRPITHPDFPHWVSIGSLGPLKYDNWCPDAYWRHVSIDPGIPSQWIGVPFGDWLRDLDDLMLMPGDVAGGLALASNRQTSWTSRSCESALLPETLVVSCGCKTGLKLKNYYFFIFTFSRPEVKKLLLFYVFTFSRPEVRKLLLFYVFTFSRPEVGKLFHISMA